MGVPRTRLRRPDSRRSPREEAGAGPGADRKGGGEAGEGGRGDAVADHAGEQVGRAGDAVDLLVAVDGAEKDEEDDRQGEGEEGGLAVSPEEALLRPELVEEEAAHVNRLMS